MSDADRAYFRNRGIAISNLVPRATARADELTADELRSDGRPWTTWWRLSGRRVVAVCGITAYRTAFGRPKTVPGRQAGDLHGAQVWVVPNPSGLNAHDTVASLAVAYAEPAAAAGLI